MDEMKSRAKILIDLWLEGELSREQSAELNQLLSDPAVEAEFQAALRMHVDLAEALTCDLPRLSAAELERLKQLEHLGGPHRKRFPSIHLDFPTTGWIWTLGSVMGLLLIGAFAFRYFSPPTAGPDQWGDPRIAQITRAASTEIADRDDSSIRAGDVIEFATGMLEVEFESGVRLLFGGPSRFRIDSAAMLTLDFGEVSGIVPPTGSGFRIRTPDGIVEDIGTEFGVRVPMGQHQTTVSVFKGEVKVFGKSSDTESKSLLAGKQVAISNGSIGDPVQIAGQASALQLDRPTFSLEAEADSYIKGGAEANQNFGKDELLMVKLDVGLSDYNRRALLRFQVPPEARAQIKAARLIMTVCTNTIASDLHPENRVADCLWKFSVGGVWDRYWKPWAEEGVNWNNAPGHRAAETTGKFFGPEAPIDLGQFTVYQHGESGSEVEISGPQLLRFLQEDEDGSVNLVVSRLTGYRWSAPGGNSEDRVVHSFASREHPSLPGPRLELWLERNDVNE
ncbi:MAG: FecR domain-containing protein [Planctomycetaceae bacterium]|nr:FecR domain-containing protein [Planctomycetaceae bacterium]